MANTYVKIATVSLSSSAATIDFSSIPSTYTDLCVKASLRCDVAGGALAVTIKANTANPTQRTVVGNGATASSLTTYHSLANGTSSTASTFANIEAYFPNYTGATAKSGSVDFVTEDNSSTGFDGLSAILYSSTAAINQITFALASGNFVQYSTATLYGIKKN